MSDDGMPWTGGPTRKLQEDHSHDEVCGRWPRVMVTESSLKQPRKASLKSWPWVLHEGDSEPCKMNIPSRGRGGCRGLRAGTGGGFPPLQLCPVEPSGRSLGLIHK